MDNLVLKAPAPINYRYAMLISKNDSSTQLCLLDKVGLTCVTTLQADWPGTRLMRWLIVGAATLPVPPLHFMTARLLQTGSSRCQDCVWPNEVEIFTDNTIIAVKCHHFLSLFVKHLWHFGHFVEAYLHLLADIWRQAGLWTSEQHHSRYSTSIHPQLWCLALSHNNP